INDANQIATAEATRTAFEEYYFFAANNDPSDPFRPRPTVDDTPTVSYNLAVDRASEALGAAAYPFTLATGPDLRGSLRLFDWVPSGSPLGDGFLLDIGAYELADPDPVEYYDNGSAPLEYDYSGDGNFSFSAQEDTIINVDMSMFVRKGFQPYTFTITPNVAIYDTDPNNPCGGQPFVFNDRSYILTFCPAQNFHNQGINDPLAEISFTYSVAGLLNTGVTDPATMTIDIDNVDDGGVTGGSELVFSSSLQSIAHPILPTYELTGQGVEITGGDPDQPTLNLDYPFTKSNYSTAAYPNNTDDLFTTNPATAFANATNPAHPDYGLLRLTPVVGKTGTFSFDYTVTDRDGDNVSRTLTLRIVQRVATQGIYDDTSLDFVYYNTWTPYYETSQYNNTSTYSTGSNASAEFYFVGDAFALDFWQFTGSGSFNLELEWDDTNANQWVPIQLNDPDLTCTDGVSTNPISTATYEIFGCYGLNTIAEDNVLWRLRITGNNIWLDSAEVRNNAFPAGYHEERDFAVIYEGANWLFSNYSSGPRGGNVAWSNTSSETATFPLNAANTNGFILYNSTAPSYGTIEICAETIDTYGGCSDVPTNLASGWANRTVISEADLNIAGSPYTHDITLRTKFNGQWIGIEGIFVRGSNNGLGTLSTSGGDGGFYNNTDDALTFNGRGWYNANTSSAAGGTVQWTRDPGDALYFNVDASVDRIMIYRATASSYGNLLVCVEDFTCETITSTGSSSYGTAVLIDLPGTGQRMVEIKKTDSRWVGVEGIQALGQPAPLAPGYYDETRTDTLFGIEYSSGWSFSSSVGPRGGNVAWSRNPTDYARFTINVNSGINDEGLMIYNTRASSYGIMEVCASLPTTPGSCVGPTVEIDSTGSGFSKHNWITETQLGLAAFSGQYTINITPKDSRWIGLEGFFVRTGSTGYNLTTLSTSGGPNNDGLYDNTDSALTYIGPVWYTANVSSATNGTVEWSNDPGAAVYFNVDSSAQRLAIYRAVASSYGSMEVYVDGSLAGTVSSTSGPSFGGAVVINLPGSGNRLVEIKATSGSWIGLEAVQVLGAPSTLDAGYYEETPQSSGFNTVYSGTWSFADTSNGPRGGNVAWSNDPNAYARFNIAVDAGINDEGVIIYNSLGSGYGNLLVCAASTATPNTCVASPISISSTGSGWAQRSWVSETQLGISGQTETYTINIEPASDDWIGLEGFFVRTGAGNYGLGTLTTTGGVNSDGLYNNTAPELTYITPAWYNADSPNSVGDTIQWNNNPGAAVYFWIDGSVERLSIFRATASSYGSMAVYIDGALAETVTSSGSSSFGNAILVDAIGNGTRLVEIKATSSSWIGLEAIKALPAPTPLAAGYYDETPGSTDFNITYTGDWSLSNYSSGPRNGNVAWTRDLSATATFDITVDSGVNNEGLFIYNSLGSNYSDMLVCANNCATISSTGSGWAKRTWVSETELGLNGQDGTQTITVRPASADWIGLEGFFVRTGGGNYGLNTVTTSGGDNGFYNNTDNVFQYEGTIWYDQSNASSQGGSVEWSNDAGAGIYFLVDGSVDRMAVYHVTGSNYGSFQICVDNNCEPPISTTGSTGFSRATLFDLPGSGTRLVEIKATSSGWIGFEGVQALGPISALPIGGPYDADDQGTNFNILYSGEWLTGLPRWTQDTNAYVEFKIDATTGFEERFVLYRSTATGYADALVEAIGSGSTTILNSTGPTGSMSPSQIISLEGDLGVSPTATGEITIRISPATENWLGIQAIQVLPAAGPLAPGYYDETQQATGFNVEYSGTWSFANASGGPRGGNVAWSNDPNAYARFDITVDAGVDNEGLLLYNSLGSGYGNMLVCAASTGSPDTCLASPISISSTGSGWAKRTWVSETQLGISGQTGTYTINIEPAADDWIGLEGFFVRTGSGSYDLGTLTTTGGDGSGFYNNTAPELTYITPAWYNAASTNSVGDTIQWNNNPGATVYFLIDGSVERLAVYRATASTYGSIDVCVDDDSEVDCTTISSSGASTFGQPVILTMPGSGTRLVEIKATSTRWIGLEGIAALGDADPVAPGYYEQSDPAMVYSATGNWVTEPSTSHSGGTSVYNGTPGSYVQFAIEDASGFVFFSSLATYGTPMSICWEARTDPGTPVTGAPDETCRNENTVSTSFRGQWGYVIDNLDTNDVYDVRVTHTGVQGSNWLYFDGLAVFGNWSAPLDPGMYNQDASGIDYVGGSTLWTTYSTSRAYDSNYIATTARGGSVQLQVNGSAITLYQTAASWGSNNVRVCLIADGADGTVANCTSISQFRAGSGTTYQTPITIFGLGSGTSRLLITNLDSRSGGFMNIDAIEVR
ncbi:MAG: hypothetical protein ACOCYT_01395, partial [Chloroflexota bacterium]